MVGLGGASFYFSVAQFGVTEYMVCTLNIQTKCIDTQCSYDQTASKDWSMTAVFADSFIPHSSVEKIYLLKL